MGGAIGWVDTLRVSPDAGPSWFPNRPFISDKTNMPAGRNMVRNSLNRLSTHGKWWVNDPDCILIREATKLTTEELQGIATVVAFTGGSLLLSDKLSSVSTFRLRVAQRLLPVTGTAAIAVDILTSEMPEILLLERFGATGSWLLLALCNWGDKPKVIIYSIFSIYTNISTL